MSSDTRCPKCGGPTGRSTDGYNEPWCESRDVPTRVCPGERRSGKDRRSTQEQEPLTKAQAKAVWDAALSEARGVRVITTDGCFEDWWAEYGTGEQEHPSVGEEQ